MMPFKLISTLIFGSALLAPSLSLGQSSSDLQSVLLSVYRHSIFKVDVSTNTAVIHQNSNICLSEGTGFLVNSSHVITADHVVNLAAECGPRIIILKSAEHNVQLRAEVVASENDVALLRIVGSSPSMMCALSIRSEDVYEALGYRFGIPGGLNAATHEPVLIQPRNSDFNPLAVLRPTFSERGESGGPVLYRYSVAGVTRSRHPTHPSISVMTPATYIRRLMQENNVSRDLTICNPSLAESTGISISPDGATLVGRLTYSSLPVRETDRNSVIQEALVRARPVVQSDLILGSAPALNFNPNGLTLQSPIIQRTAPTVFETTPLPFPNPTQIRQEAILEWSLRRFHFALDDVAWDRLEIAGRSSLRVSP